MSRPPITPEQLSALPPEIRALVQAIIDHYERQLGELRAELAAARKTLAAVSQQPLD